MSRFLTKAILYAILLLLTTQLSAEVDATRLQQDGDMTSRRSTPAEWEQRKELHRELVSLRNVYRQRPFMILNMGRFRSLADRHWQKMVEKYKGKVRSIPICEELIPAEYLTTEKLKEDYYNQFAWEHTNFCNYVQTLPAYDQLICAYFSLSTELEELQKPIWNLEPSTSYSLKNLQGRMKYLKQLYPDLRKLEQQISEAENPRPSSKVNRSERLALCGALAQMMEQLESPTLIQENIDEFKRIAEAEWDKAERQYQGKISMIPMSREEFLPKECLSDPKAREEYLSRYQGWGNNYLDYLDKLPEREYLICCYFRFAAMINDLQAPIVDLWTDAPYPLDNLRLRLRVIQFLLGEVSKIQKKIIQIEKNPNHNKE